MFFVSVAQLVSETLFVSGVEVIGVHLWRGGRQEGTGLPFGIGAVQIMM